MSTLSRIAIQLFGSNDNIQEQIRSALDQDDISLKWLSFLAITGVTAEVEEYFGLKITDDYRQFLDKYYRTFYTARSEYQSIPYQKCLQAAASGRLDVIQHQLELYSVDPIEYEEMVKRAAKYGQLDILQFFESLGDFKESAIDGAVSGLQSELMVKLMEKKPGTPFASLDTREWEDQLGYQIGKRNDRKLIRQLRNHRKKKYPNWIRWDDVLIGAAKGGHWNLVHTAIRKGAIRYGIAFMKAIQNNHVKITERIFQEYPFEYDLRFRPTTGWSAYELQSILIAAAKINFRPLLNLMWERLDLQKDLKSYEEPMWDDGGRDAFLRSCTIKGAIAAGNLEMVREFYVPASCDIIGIIAVARTPTPYLEIAEFILASVDDDRKVDLVNTGFLNACESESMYKFDRHRMVEFFLRHGANVYKEGLDLLAPFTSFDPELVARLTFLASTA